MQLNKDKSVWWKLTEWYFLMRIQIIFPYMDTTGYSTFALHLQFWPLDGQKNWYSKSVNTVQYNPELHNFEEDTLTHYQMTN